MMEDKQNILKSFQGKRIDESVHVARWGTMNNQDSARNVFQKYAAGSSNTIQQNSSEILRNENAYNTQESQVHEIDTGFKRLKNNQLEMLKDLKNEHEVLRSLNIEQKPTINKNTHKMKSSSSSANCIDQPSDQMLSSSSHRSKQKIVRKQNITREAQILALQKKQLQMVINNSMRKIQQLLHSQMQYKKQIHELKLQVSGRQNTDIQYQSMFKTLKKAQINQHETIQSLKKEHEKSRYQVRQLNQKISVMQGQILVKQQEIRRLFEQKRKSQDLIRLEKDRYFNVDIDYKKIKMEYELLQKQKNSEINRLTRQFDWNSGNKVRELQTKLKRYEEDLQVKDKRYNTLLNQLQDMRKRFTQQELQINQFKANQQSQIQDKERIEDILTQFRDQNNSVSFNRNINEVLQKLHHIDNNQDDYLKRQVEMLKMQLQSLKQIDVCPRQDIQKYVERIGQLQKNLRYESSSKQETTDSLKRLERDYEQLYRKSNQNQGQIQQHERLQQRLREQARTLKTLLAQRTHPAPSLRQQKLPQVQKLQELNQLRVQRQVETLRGQLQAAQTKARQKSQQLQAQLTRTRRLSDQNEFKSTTTATQMQFRLRMQQDEHSSIALRMRQDSERQQGQLLAITGEFQRYKASSQSRTAQSEGRIHSLKAALREATDDRQRGVSNVRLEYQSLLKTEREAYKMEMEMFSSQVASLSRTNQKYLQQSSKLAHYENQLSCLREIMRRSIHLSQGADHLWRIKETQYQNVNQILRQITSWQY